MPRPALLVRFSERRHRKRASEGSITHSTSNHQPASPPTPISAPPTAVPQARHSRHRSLASITSILKGDRHHYQHHHHQQQQQQHPQHQISDQPTPVLDPYPKPVDLIRREEYPHMNSSTYLDHAGTTIYATSLIKRFSALLQNNLYGNPHSYNQPAKLSGDVVDSVRLKTLRFLGADPKHFDLIFTANATAAIKLVADAFRDLAEQSKSKSFWYGYHRDAHTSLVGVRELTSRRDDDDPSSASSTYRNQRCFADDDEVEHWLSYGDERDEEDESGGGRLGLFAWPGQSNLTGRRLPLREWAGRVRNGRRGLRGTYTLLDGAGLAMTGEMRRVFEDVRDAPDFVCLSFYKVFGFPDLGGLVVRKDSGHILALRKYFGGGTVTMVSTLGRPWHTSKGLEQQNPGEDGHGDGAGNDGGHGGGGLHDGLEDGTLPFHNILALGEAMDVFTELYGSMENVSRHTTALVLRLYQGMKGMRYANGQPVCKIYMDEAYGDPGRQGATVAFNVFKPDGRYESYARVESLANERGIYVRSGGICCPGGVFTALQYEPWQLNRARSAGHHCGPQGLSVINELPTGVVRASLGAMSTVKDVDTFLAFLQDTFVTPESSPTAASSSAASVSHTANHEMFEERMSEVTTCCA